MKWFRTILDGLAMSIAACSVLSYRRVYGGRDRDVDEVIEA